MNIFRTLRRTDINDGVENFRKQKDAILLDVRSKEEFADGHIENSVNLPLTELSVAKHVIPQTETPLFVYCHSGGRSERAIAVLKQLGYENVTNIGGINSYKGEKVID